MIQFSIPVALAVALCLSGCSDNEPAAANPTQVSDRAPTPGSAAPSVEDMKRALGAHRLFVTSVKAEGFDPALVQVQKGECLKASDVPGIHPSEATGYVCEIKIGFEKNGTIDYSPWQRGRFFFRDDQWNYQRIRDR